MESVFDLFAPVFGWLSAGRAVTSDPTVTMVVAYVQRLVEYALHQPVEEGLIFMSGLLFLQGVIFRDHAGRSLLLIVILVAVATLLFGHSLIQLWAILVAHLPH